MLNKLRNKIFGDRSSDITGIYYLLKDLKCLPEVIGREYEVLDKDGKIVYTIIQKPMTIPQLQVLLKELSEHNRREAREYKKARKK